MKVINDSHTHLPFVFASDKMPFGDSLYQAMPGFISKRPPLVCRASTTGIVEVARIIQGRPFRSRPENFVVLKKSVTDMVVTLKDEGAVLMQSSRCSFWICSV